jgi:hypothetical protein
LPAGGWRQGWQDRRPVAAGSAAFRFGLSKRLFCLLSFTLERALARRHRGKRLISPLAAKALGFLFFSPFIRAAGSADDFCFGGRI